MSTLQTIGAIVVAVFTVIVAVVGATWVILEEINKSHVELQKQISESRVEFHKEISKLRGDVANVGSKFDEFEDSHRREHDLFYGQGGQ